MTDGHQPVVLVVEDERSLLGLYQVWLADTYDLRTAADGEAALQRLDDAVDAVLLDRRLPGLSGDTVLDRIRQEDDCPVGLISAAQPDFDLLDLAFDGHLTKPVSREELHGVVSRLLRVAEFEPAVREYYRLLVKRSVLEAHKHVIELDTHEAFQSITAELEVARDALAAEEVDSARSLLA